jgi:hypothetical protein
MPRSPLVTLVITITLLGLARRGAAEVRADMPPRLRSVSTPGGG